MRVVVLGARGMLGTDLVAEFADHDVAAHGSEVDIRDADAVARAIGGADLVLNAAAYTGVDAAEDDETTATAVNGTGAGIAAAAAHATGARFVQYSTDYVFDGSAREPYAEDAPLAPIGAYGRSKAAGEAAVRSAHPGAWIVRTAWLYGAYGACFPRTMLRLAAERDTVSVVTDQIGQPTWTRDVARATRRLADADAPAGVFHATASGRASWFEFARAVFDEAGLDPARVLPTDGAAFPRRAPRPAFSVLGHDAWAAAGLPEPQDWRAALAEAAAKGVLVP